MPFVTLLSSKASNRNVSLERDPEQEAVTKPLNQTTLKLPGLKTTHAHDLHAMHNEKKQDTRITESTSRLWQHFRTAPHFEPRNPNCYLE